MPKKSLNLFLAIFLIIFISFVLVLISKALLIEKVQNYDVFINVANRIGINISNDTENINFGTIPPGSYASKNLSFANTEHFPSRIIMKSYGEMKDWISVSENNFILNTNENRTINVNADIPSNAELRSYKGKIRIIFMRVL